MRRFKAWMATCTALVAAAGNAAAQSPEGLLEESSATSGSTEVAKSGFETVQKPTSTESITQLEFSGGGLMTTGNARSTALTGAGQLRLRRDKNEYSASVAANYARGAVSADEPTETTVENLQGRIRYDRFLSESWALFAAESARRDRFQGLDLRFNFDPGVAYYVFDFEKHRLWAEAGYDLQFDIRTADALVVAADEGAPVSKTAVRHAGRLFAGYQNDLNEAVRFNTGVEYLQAIIDTENWRFNWNVGLTSAISTNFSFATTFNLRYDNNPLPGVEKTDTTTAVNLVYTLL